MKKLLQFLDNYLLKIGVCLIIAFIPLYPKLPSIAITHTWVYIRLEDFLICAVAGIWFIQLLRKKVSLPFSLSIPFAVYWIAGLLSLVFSIIFIGPHLANFFPKIAAFQYVRRIEYMILFFVGFSSVRSKKDVRDYLIILGMTISGILVYGLGQRFYLSFWAAFPDFAQKYPFCFPSFQTGNEEFAKGMPLCLPGDARITSTFGGHYDLAAYLVIIIPVLIGLFTTAKKWGMRILLAVLSIGSIMLLIFTASRISFAAYLVGATLTLIWMKRKRYIVPVLLISMIILVSFSGSLAKRFLETIRFTSIVTNTQGQVVGVDQSTLPTDLKNKIAKNSAIEENVPTQNLPTGSSFITLPSARTPVATSVAVVKTSLTNEQIRQLKLKNGGVELSTVSGNFLVQKALVYDISFTTRFQGEWPNAWAAFMRNPLLGSGYSSITLASDNDYLRTLGESGTLGMITFLIIFMVFGIFMKKTASLIKDPMERALAWGLAGGVIGLFINATLIDVFEASKVAESLWILLGIGVGSLALYQKHKIAYWKELLGIFTSPFCIALYFFILTFILYGATIGNFFVGDDFTWLHWAGDATAGSLKTYFFDSTGFFYRPLAKGFMFLMYTFFSFYPQGYHVILILLHFLMSWGVYLLANRLIRNKYLSFLAGVLFLLLPGRVENFFWISTLSIEMASVFALYSVIFFINFRKSASIVSYVLSCIFALLGLFSYEGSVILPLVFIAYDICIFRKKELQTFLSYIPYIIILLVYSTMRVLSHALGPNGDYSYNLSHLVPNFFGNLLGYIMLFFFGENSLPFYNALRSGTKSISIFLILLGIVFLGFAIFFMMQKSFRKIMQHKQFLMSSFLILFVIIAVLPFLGFGNITQRYGYFASAGFVILLVVILQAITQKLASRAQYIVITVLLVLFGTFGYSLIQSANADWSRAGKITDDALTYIKVYGDEATSGSYFYFVDVPIKYHNAWVFPVGLEDGLWFLYRDPSIHIIKTSSLNDAKTLRASVLATSKVKAYIFVFDQKGNIQEIK